mmetsp:Transcript_26565/g.41219  ORF Transcript_26565/g.41219 Transcript_26565/m.41219 type:complete len:102 (-) Transcript_26565:4040-4345(-)
MCCRRFMRFLGFLGQRVIWPNTASLMMLPRDGVGVGSWDLSSQPDHFINRAWVIILFEKALHRIAPYLIPLLQTIIVFEIVGLRGVRKRGCELLQYTFSLL